MSIRTDKIWLDGELIRWEDAKVHVLAHALHYGTGYFEGIRCYELADGRSDVFALGIVLFELLTGQPPFAADNLSALLFAIAHHPHPEVQTLRPDLPPLLQEIVNRALQKELPQRYRRAGELAQDLRACLHSLAA